MIGVMETISSATRLASEQRELILEVDGAVRQLRRDMLNRRV